MDLDAHTPIVRLEVSYERGEWFADVTLYHVDGLVEVRAAVRAWARPRGRGLPEVNATTITRDCIARARRNRAEERRVNSANLAYAAGRND
jgi:hypothetical protein